MPTPSLRFVSAMLGAAALAGCQAVAQQNPLAPPQLSPVGQGIATTRTSVPVTVQPGGHRAYQSLWSSRDKGLFQDVLARRVGDILTVSISIDDKAQFDNATGRSRQQTSKRGLAASLGFGGFGATAKAGQANGSLETNSDSQARGEGSIDRSEKLRLSVAAVVTEVLPDGNLLISGTQEVRVNYEVRVLSVAGIVRPTDISSSNTVAYDKIAEARISYGGRGRLSEMQQPSWGQRLLDAAAPF